MISLKEYLKDKRNYSVNMTEDYVTWKDECYNIIYKDDIPYVEIRKALALSQMKEMVKTINNRKIKPILKGKFITIRNNSYHIIGIGGEAIKASKNGEEPEFFRYVGTRSKNLEAQELLQVLYDLSKEIEV